jgi:hypothetical protein
MKKERMLPAIPPEDYKGTIHGWTVALIQSGHWNGRLPEWYGDIEIPESVYLQILEKCES